MEDKKPLPERDSIAEVLKKYKEQHGTKNTGHLVSPENEMAQTDFKEPEAQKPVTPVAVTNNIPEQKFNPEQYQNVMSQETDPDLMMSYEVVKLPSKGLFYKNKISEVNIEYMTSKDEDLLTTPSLIDNGTVLDILLKRKIKSKGLNVEDMMQGDRNAIILFLRSSSYGSDYAVQVPDPRTNALLKTSVDLTKLRYKKVNENPNELGHFNVKIPMRKKDVVFKLLTVGEDNHLFKQAEALKEAMSLEFSEYSTMKLKANIISIDGNTDRSYINKFVDVMPALDALTIRRKIQEISPDVDMEYEFVAKDGFKFKAELSVGIDFFFPST